MGALKVTNPLNVRTSVTTVDFAQGAPLTEPQFDAQGKLIGYENALGGGNITITWNCR